MNKPDLPREHLFMSPGVILTAGMLVLSGCSSSSSSSPASLHAQAVDGYLVGSTVYCDGVFSGVTGAAGAFTCPAGTQVYRITGGADVGFDETAVDGGTPFVGELTGPSSIAYVTPLTTMVTALSTINGVFDPDAVDNQLQRVIDVFNLPTDTQLSTDPTADENIELIKFNAQIQEVAESLSTNPDEYTDVIEALTATVANTADTSEELDIVTNLQNVLTLVNVEMLNINSALNLSESELLALTTEVEETIRGIGNSTSKEGVALEASNPSGSPAFSIERDSVMVKIGLESGGESVYNLDDFESDIQTDGRYTVLTSHLNNSIGFNRESISVRKNLADQAIDLGFEIDSTDNNDPRKLSVVAIGASATMVENDNTSISIVVPDGTVLYVTAVDSNNTTTNATFTVNGDETFSSSNSIIEIDLTDIETRLANQGITGFLDRSGNYRVKMVVAGMQIGQTEGGGEVLLDAITVQADGRSVSGHGFLGFASFFNQ